jgi:hypothetical protein
LKAAYGNLDNELAEMNNVLTIKEQYNEEVK